MSDGLIFIMDVGSLCIFDVQESKIEDYWTSGDGNRGGIHKKAECYLIGGLLIAILNLGARDGRVSSNWSWGNGTKWSS